MAQLPQSCTQIIFNAQRINVIYAQQSHQQGGTANAKAPMSTRQQVFDAIESDKAAAKGKNVSQAFNQFDEFTSQMSRRCSACAVGVCSTFRQCLNQKPIEKGAFSAMVQSSLILVLGFGTEIQMQPVIYGKQLGKRLEADLDHYISKNIIQQYYVDTR